MTERGAARVESALGHPLPAGLRAFLVGHHDELERIKAALPLRRMPYSDPKQMISDNTFARKVPNDVYVIGEEGRPWPERFLLIESNGAGDHWFMDRDGADPGVWAWDDGAIKEVAGSLGELLEQMRADLRDPGPWQSRPQP